MYGLPHAGKIANDRLIKHLVEHGYVQAKHTHGLFTRESRKGLMFSLVIDDFGVYQTRRCRSLGEHIAKSLHHHYQLDRLNVSQSHSRWGLQGANLRRFHAGLHFSSSPAFWRHPCADSRSTFPTCIEETQLWCEDPAYRRSRCFHPTTTQRPQASPRSHRRPFVFRSGSRFNHIGSPRHSPCSPSARHSAHSRGLYSSPQLLRNPSRCHHLIHRQ